MQDNMAHWAKIENGIVVQVNVVEDNFIQANPDRYTGQWVKTSYNTQGGVHLLGGTPLRKNFAGIGFTYDAVRDAFIPQKPFDSWLLNEDTCQWESPIPYPTDDKHYVWDEEQQNWKEIQWQLNS
jgi:hypothetical protein